MLSDSTVYLDHACATPVRREVLDKILPVLCNFTGAAGASHAASRRADVLITEARRAVRSCLGAEQGSLRFTEGGGSASQSAILGLALSRGRNGHILTTRDEDEGVQHLSGGLAQAESQVREGNGGCGGRRSFERVCSLLPKYP